MIMQKVQDYVHVFEGLWDDRVKCRVRVYREQGSPPVIICTELPDNQGGYIGLTTEGLVAEVWKLEQRPEAFTWIEHDPAVLSGEGAETFHKVTFVRVPGVDGRFLSPSWELMTREAVESLIGQHIEAH